MSSGCLPSRKIKDYRKKEGLRYGPWGPLEVYEGEDKEDSEKRNRIRMEPRSEWWSRSQGGIESKNERTVWRKNITVDQRLINTLDLAVGITTDPFKYYRQNMGCYKMKTK